MSGILYLVSTPIGNLEDITMRALGILRQVDLIACEDTRHTRKLLSHYQISKPLTALHEHNERARAAGLADKLEAGIDIALVCDAGTPTVSDPGYRLVREAVQRGIRVVSIPGPSALITALAASGLPTDQFTFAGFLPARRGARRARLAELAHALGFEGRPGCGAFHLPSTPNARQVILRRRTSSRRGSRPPT